MVYSIDFATRNEEERLREIFVSTGMDLVGETEDHIVIKKHGEILGGALLYQTEQNLFHLLTIAIRQSLRSSGSGSRLLQHILEQPWNCCSNGDANALPSYRVTTVSRGESRNFYLKNGMSDCSFQSLVPPFDQQCLSCPDLNDCHSAALEYSANNLLDEEKRAEQNHVN